MISEEAKRAIQSEIDYLEDNGYRYKLDGNTGEYLRHKKLIKKLEDDLEKINSQSGIG